MTGFETGLQNVTDGQGVPIAVAGMSIVFVALFLITAFITVLPRLLGLVGKVFPEQVPERRRPPVEEDELAIVAAIGAAMHRRRAPAAR